MIAWTPASIAARNGVRATSSIESTTGRVRCESSDVSPWPGKCLAHAATPALWSPCTNAATCRATRSPSDPNERIPITGFCGFVFTSATGAKSRFTPAAASSAPSEAATRSVRSTSSTTPSAPLPGYELPVAASRRVTSPPSSSIAIRMSGRSERRSSVSARSCSWLSTFQAYRTTPPSPSASRRRQPVGHDRALEAREDAARGQPFELAHQALTAPAVRPNAILRCTSRKKITTGIAVSVDAAMSPPQSMFRLVP